METNSVRDRIMVLSRDIQFDRRMLPKATLVRVVDESMPGPPTYFDTHMIGVVVLMEEDPNDWKAGYFSILREDVEDPINVKAEQIYLAERKRRAASEIDLSDAAAHHERVNTTDPSRAPMNVGADDSNMPESNITTTAEALEDTEQELEAAENKVRYLTFKVEEQIKRAEDAERRHGLAKRNAERWVRKAEAAEQKLEAAERELEAEKLEAYQRGLRERDSRDQATLARVREKAEACLAAGCGMNPSDVIAALDGEAKR